MPSQFDVTSYTPPAPPAPAEPPLPVADLLRQILEVQREQLAQMQASAAAHDASARWRALLARWRDEFPGLPDACRGALPILERAYGSIISNMVEELRDNGDSLESEFALQDFLDRYGLRLGQMGNILNLVGPLAEAGSQNEAS
ncbi:MAG TPA: hypothetical protein VEL76_28300 [Gemmataceae bacterium]|nr:hypothetical protein [Gemmataceae bacterium]